ncbi:aspartic peptidase domain-containing protein [Fomes fomentarius]|nr:aspartic peptidase domain-containing protein [Fomes fomentarius]
MRSGRPCLPIVRRAKARSALEQLQTDQRGTLETSDTARRGISDVLATNQLVEYIATVGVGTPPKNYTLLIDNGSSNTFGAQSGSPFVPSESTIMTGNAMSKTYGPVGQVMFGQEFIDTVTIGGLSVVNQSIGAVELEVGFDGIDGILGLGVTNMTFGTRFPDHNSSFPTIIDNAFNQGLIEAHQIGISFEPTTSINDTNGEITLGGVDTTRFIGPLDFIPTTSIFPANTNGIGFNQSITFGSPGGPPILAPSAGITETRTSLIFLTTGKLSCHFRAPLSILYCLPLTANQPDAFNTYKNLTGAILDDTTGLLRLTPEQYASLSSLFFHIGENIFEFTANAQIFPRKFNAALGGTSEFVYLVMGDIGAFLLDNVEDGLNFVNGVAFLERFYYAYDFASDMVGFAATPFTNAHTN